MLSAIIIAKTIAGLSVGPLIKKQLSDCTFYGQQKHSRPVLFKRFDKCYKELVNEKSSRVRDGDEQGFRKQVEQGKRDSLVAQGKIARVQRGRAVETGIIDEVSNVRGWRQDNDEQVID